MPTTKIRPRGYWKDKQNQKEFFDQLAIKWNIQKPEDWNKVTQEMAWKEGGYFINQYYNSSLQRGTNMHCIVHSDILMKHYKQSILIMYQRRNHEDIGKTSKIKRNSLINWPSNGIFKSQKIGTK
jgi:hypothetical protein